MTDSVSTGLPPGFELNIISVGFRDCVPPAFSIHEYYVNFLKRPAQEDYIL